MLIFSLPFFLFLILKTQQCQPIFRKYLHWELVFCFLTNDFYINGNDPHRRDWDWMNQYYSILLFSRKIRKKAFLKMESDVRATGEVDAA